MKIIIQAGGLGSRMKFLTKNKPKALIAINCLPILFHLFKQFPKDEFVIIGDYKYEVLDKYLSVFAKQYNYILVKTDKKGNIAGIKEALSYIPYNEAFLLIWSDLILPEGIKFPNKIGCQVGAVDFPCSWSIIDGKLLKEQRNGKGVAGLYLFSDKRYCEDIPEEGSFTTWLASKEIPLSELKLEGCLDIGSHEAYEKLSSTLNRCRPYNKMDIHPDKVIKTGLTTEGQKLIDREVVWYNKVKEYGFTAIPEIYQTSPLTMERIDGENIFLAKLSDSEKKVTIDKLVEALDFLHKADKAPADAWDVYKEYFSKTIDRLQSISYALPFADDEFITINGKTYLNVLRRPQVLRQAVLKSLMISEIVPIHGDCTLTNTMIDKSGKIYFIDARGYFGKSVVLGDENYDWVKLYYSINGNFDQFNIKNFDFIINENNVDYKIHSGGWEHLTDYFLNKIPNVNLGNIKLIHAIVWLSLASHAWEDFDSMCVAFYNGTVLFNEWLEEYGRD